MISATSRELATLPAALAAARWEPQLKHRNRTRWRSAQQAVLVELSECRLVLSDTLDALVAVKDRSAMSVRILRKLQPELVQLVECARVFVGQVAGRPRTETARLASACEAALEAFDDAFRRVRLEVLYAGNVRLSDGEHQDIVLAYTLLFCAVNFVVKLRALTLPPPSKRRSMMEASWSACGRVVRSVCAEVQAVFIGGRYAERIKDGVRLSAAITLAAALAAHLPKGAWAPVTVGFVWEPGLGATLRNSGTRLQGSVLGVFFGFSAFSLGGHFADDTSRNAALLSLFAGWVALCCFVKAASSRQGYAGFVAAFTASVVLTGPECGGLGAEACEGERDETGVTQLALARIQMTLIGIASLLVTGATVFPVHTPSLIFARVGDVLSSVH